MVSAVITKKHHEIFMNLLRVRYLRYHNNNWSITVYVFLNFTVLSLFVYCLHLKGSLRVKYEYVIIMNLCKRFLPKVGFGYTNLYSPRCVAVRGRWEWKCALQDSTEIIGGNTEGSFSFVTTVLQ